MSRRRNSEAMDTNFTGPPVVQTTQLNNPTPPIIPPQPRFPSSQLYQIPDGYVVHPWDVVGPSTHLGFNQNTLGPQFGGRRVVHEEDAGALPDPGENVVRLPPDYKEAWSQGNP